MFVNNKLLFLIDFQSDFYGKQPISKRNNDKNVKVVREDTNLHEVIATLSSFEINSLIVVQGERPVGIITTKDALVRGFEHGMPVTAITAGKVASSPLITINEEATVDEAVRLMKRSRIRHLPVLSNNKLVGIISDTDIIFAVPSMLSTMEDFCRPQK
jgi:CBS domain-containing protein